MTGFFYIMWTNDWGIGWDSSRFSLGKRSEIRYKHIS